MPGRTRQLSYWQILFWLTLGLIALGLVMVYSASGAGTSAIRHTGGNSAFFFVRQVKMAVVGIALLLGISCIKLEVIKKSVPFIWVISVILLILVLIPGVGVRGNKAGGGDGALRWIAFGGFRFQPSELFKLADIMLFAGMWGKMLDEGRKSLKRMCIISIITLAPMVLIILEPDFGSIVLGGTIIGGLAFWGGLPIPLVSCGFIMGAGVSWIYFSKKEHAVNRILAWLSPEEYAQGIGYQIVHSQDSFAAGGFLGTGIGEGQQKFTLPEAHTDYIVSVVAEELGLFTVVLVMLAFLGIALVAILLSKKQRQISDKFMIIGTMLVVVLPALVNIAMAANLLPSKGLTLPFLSYGGTSMIVSCLAIGILGSFAKETEEQLYG